MRNFVITVNGKSYDVAVEEVGGAPVATPVVKTVAPVATPAPVVAAPAPAKAAPANGEKILSPFPGLIKNLLVAEGATVKKDQPILVLEAMKMENELMSPVDGVVSSVVITKGATVESGALLCTIA